MANDNRQIGIAMAVAGIGGAAYLLWRAQQAAAQPPPRDGAGNGSRNGAPRPCGDEGDPTDPVGGCCSGLVEYKGRCYQAVYAPIDVPGNCGPLWTGQVHGVDFGGTRYIDFLTGAISYGSCGHPHDAWQKSYYEFAVYATAPDGTARTLYALRQPRAAMGHAGSLPVQLPVNGLVRSLGFSVKNHESIQFADDVEADGFAGFRGTVAY